MTSFVLKIIAMITMLIDHIGFAAFHHVTYFNVIGRMAFPIFAFQISEGYTHTKNLKKYVARLFLFALVSQPSFQLFHSLASSEIALNIFFTLLTGLIAMIVYDKIINMKTSFLQGHAKIEKTFKQVIALFIVALFGVLAEVCKFDYGFFGILIIFLFYRFRNSKISMVISFVAVCVLKYTIRILHFGYHYYYILLCLFTILPIVFLCLYNGKQGRKIKYFLYFFYPVHLLVLYLIFR